MIIILSIGFGGFIGANLRYFFSTWIANETPQYAFPYGTFIVNMIGCFGLALFATLATEQLKVSETLRLMIATGFFGSLTTFSTFSLENYMLLMEGQISAGLLNAFMSLLVGLMATIFGVWVAQLF